MPISIQDIIIKRYESFVLGKCKCGCKTEIKLRAVRGHLQTYENHHHVKNRLAESNPNWKGGRIKTKQGYYKIYKPEHHFANSQGYIMEHRWIYEQFHKCILLPWAVVHHIEPVTPTYCNNNIENLYVFDTSGKHMSFENKGNDYGKFNRKDMSDRRCSICGSDNLDYIRKDTNSPQWFGNKKEGWRCLKCNRKIYYEKNKYRFWLK